MDSPHQDSYWLISQCFFSPQIIQLLQFFAQIMLCMFMTLNSQPNISYWCPENKQRNYFLIGETRWKKRMVGTDMCMYVLDIDVF